MRVTRLPIILLFSMSVVPVAANPLTGYQWQHRLLLVFAPDLQHSQLQQLTRQLQQRDCELNDRDMLTGYILAKNHSRLAGKPLPTEESDTLRQHYGIQLDQFAVLLIGKDGGEKYRLYEVPELEEIFALVDGMPMRQDEMQRKPVDCTP